MSKSKIQSLYEQHNDGQGHPSGRPRLCYGDGPWDAWAVQAQTGRTLRITYPTKRRYDDGTIVEIPWTVESLTNHLALTLREISRAYKGVWVLEIVERGQRPFVPHVGPNPLAHADRAVKRVPEPLPVKMPTRADIERIAVPVEPSTASPSRFDPEHDPELQGDIKHTREPGEEG